MQSSETTPAGVRALDGYTRLFVPIGTFVSTGAQRVVDQNDNTHLLVLALLFAALAAYAIGANAVINVVRVVRYTLILLTAA